MPLPGGYDLPEPPPVPDSSTRHEVDDPSVEHRIAGQEPVGDMSAGIDMAMAAMESARKQSLAAAGFPERAITAVTLILLESGTWVANSNLIGSVVEQTPQGPQMTKVGTLPPLDAMPVQRECSIQEMRHACAVVGLDAGALYQAHVNALEVQQRAQAQMAAMAQRQEAEAIMQRVQQNGGLGGAKLLRPGMGS